MRLSKVVFINTYICSILALLIAYKAVELPFMIVFLGLMSAGIFMDIKKRYPIPRNVLNLTALMTVIITIFRINIKDPLVPILDVALILLGIKLVESKKFRDYMQIYLLCLFLFAGSAFFTFSIKFLLYFLIILILISISAVFLTVINHSKDERINRNNWFSIFSFVTMIPLSAIPLGVVIFAILPRPTEPIFSLIHKTKAASGFSDRVALGEVSEIQNADITVMRVKTKRVPKNLLYWRGVVLNYFDGITWKRKETETTTKRKFRGKIAVEQKIYLEPYQGRFLFALDLPVKIKLKRVEQKRDFVIKVKKDITKRITYYALSYIDGIPEDPITSIYFQIPTHLPKEIESLSKKLCKKDAEETIKNILNYFKNNFKYSSKRLPTSKNPLKEFLKIKRGNCEFFSSATALILRTCGIPSRLVAGYKGGEYNDIGKYYRVSQKDAHVWVEAFVKKRGWIRIDPTPAKLSIAKKSVITELQKLLDLINYYWVILVINYDLDRQLSIIRSISQLNFKVFYMKYIRYLAYLTAFLFLVWILHIKVKNKSKYLKPEEKLINQFLQKIEKLGYKKRESLGFREFVNTINEEYLKEKALDFLLIVEPAIYGRSKLNQELIKKAKRIIDGLNKSS